MTTTTSYNNPSPSVSLTALERSMSLPQFYRDGLAGDEWLLTPTGNTASDVKPYIVPFDGVINTVTVNCAAVANFDVQIFVNGVLDFFFTLANVKSAQHTGLTFAVNQGDELAVFSRDAGIAPTDLSVWLTMGSA